MTHLFVVIQAYVMTITERVRREEGATAVEYALMVGLIVLAIIGSVGLFSSRLTGAFNTYANTMPS